MKTIKAVRKILRPISDCGRDVKAGAIGELLYYTRGAKVVQSRKAATGAVVKFPGFYRAFDVRVADIVRMGKGS